MKLKSVNFEPLSESPGWYSTPHADRDCTPLLELALQLQAEAATKGFYCLCGMKEYEGYRLYLAPAEGVRSIIEAFAIGSHGGDDSESVYSQISAANAQNPLVPYFADAAGLKAKFTKPVSQQLIKLLEETVSNGEIMMSDDDGSIGEFVRRNQEIQLWWD